jgi:hypothetical protein
MADDTAAKKPKPKVEPSKWARQKPQGDPIIEKRRKLWAAINDFVVANGGWIVSPPGTQNLRIEVPERSDLPAKLIDLGYRPLNIGQASRLAAKPGAITPWVVVDVIAISLPR